MLYYYHDKYARMQYEYNTETSEMCSWRDEVGMASYTAMQLKEFLATYPEARPYGACGVGGCNDCV